MSEGYLTGREVLKLLADGADWADFLCYPKGGGSLALSDVPASVFCDDDYKFKRSFDEIEVELTLPEPLDCQPDAGDWYYTILGGDVVKRAWFCAPEDKRTFDAGLAWATEKQAQAALDALSAALGVKK